MPEKIKKYRYPGIRSFSKEEEKIFFGRNADTETIYASIHLNSVTTVFGQSGIGKTSVINAGVITRFEKYNKENKTNNFSIIRVETGNYIPQKDDAGHATLVEIVAEKCFGNSVAVMPLPIFSGIDLKQNLWLQFKLQQTKNAPVILIFDQAEQLFTFPTQDFNVFLSNLKSLTSKYVPDEIRSLADAASEKDFPEEMYNHLYAPLEIKLVFVIRSDKLQLLSRLKNIIPAILQNCYEILPFDFSKAKEAIIAPSQFDGKDYTPKFEITDDAITRILTILSSKIGTLDNPNETVVEPYYLQIICQHIEREIVKGRENIVVNDTDLPQNLTDIVGKYYIACIKNLEISETEKNKVQDFIELKMIYEPDSRRITIDKAMIVSDKNYTITETILNKLIKDRLLTSEKNISGGELYRLTHDCLVEPILAIKRKRSDEYNKIKQQGDLLVNQQKYDEAVSLYSKCIENAASLNANFSDILKARANIYYLQKKYKLSNNDYLDALALDTTDFLTLYYIGLNYFYLADDDNAEIYLEKAAHANTSYAASIYNEAGVLYYNNNLLPLAEKYYAKAVTADPHYSTGYYNLGLLYRVQKRFDEAVTNLNKTLELDANSADAYNELGNLYLNNGDNVNAQKNYETATSLDPKYYYAWYNLGDIEYNKENYNGAIEYYKKAIESNNKYVDAYLKIATVFSVTKDFKGIIDYINVLLEIDPQSSEAYAWLGYAYINLKEFDNALKNLNVAVSIKPMANAYYNVGYAYQETGNNDEAEKNYTKALETDKDYLGAAENLANLFINQKKYAETITLLEEYVLAGKTTLRMFYLIGQAYINTNELNKAKDSFLKIVNTIYDYSSYLFLADVERDLKNFDEALNYYKKILETETENSTAIEYAGTLLYDQSKYEDALKYYTKLTGLLPDSAYAFNLLGNCYYQLKAYASAKESYYKAVEKDSSFYHSIYNLGLTAQNMEMYDEAINFFKKAIELNPDYAPAYQSMSTVFIKQKNYTAAVKQLEILAEKQPAASNYLEVASIYFYNLNDNIQAKKFALLAIESDKNADAPYALAGLAELNNGNQETALEYFNKALEINTQNADAYNGIGRIKIAQNNYEDALGYLETAIKLAPGFTDAYNNLGHCYFNMNPYKKAAEMFTKSVEADHTNFYALVNLAESQFYLEKYSEAEKNIQEALAVNPEYDDAYFVQSLLLQQAGKLQEAIESLKSCLKLNPDHARAAEQLKLIDK